MEQFVIRTNGGPEPGLYFSDDSVTSWPLPEMLVAPGGHYQKIRESQMPALDGPAAQHLVRGAEYEWVEDQDGVVFTDQSTPVEVDANDDNGEDDWVVGQET
jgi:hypothetical protein